MQIVAANWDRGLTGSLQNRRTTRMRGRLRTNGGQACQGWYWRHTMPTVEWAAVVFSSGRFSSLWAKSRHIEINCQKSFTFGTWLADCWLLVIRGLEYYERRWRDWGYFWRQYTPQPQLSSLLNLNEFPQLRPIHSCTVDVNIILGPSSNTIRKKLNPFFVRSISRMHLQNWTLIIVSLVGVITREQSTASKLH